MAIGIAFYFASEKKTLSVTIESNLVFGNMRVYQYVYWLDIDYSKVKNDKDMNPIDLMLKL